IRSARMQGQASLCHRSSSRRLTPRGRSCWRSSSPRASRLRHRRSGPPRRATRLSLLPSRLQISHVELYPAVDIEGGRVARAHGAVAEPLAALDAFARAGTRWIHLVDMDRAYGRPDNHELVGAVLQAAKVQV